MLDKFIEFLQDDNATEMYIYGMPGTGKTTSLADLIKYCIENKVGSTTCAYTHQAVSILRSKLPTATESNNLCTLHSFLKKIPTVNTEAVKVQWVDSNSQVGTPIIPRVLFIDEFSMIGAKDYESIKLLQKLSDEKAKLKVVYLGDKNQLPPVKDDICVEPNGKYQVELTKIHRQKDDNPLIDVLISLNSYINGAKPAPLVSNEKFVRHVDLVEQYKKCKTNKILLAYTNYRVQELNAAIEGRAEPVVDDLLYSPTIKKSMTLINVQPTTPSITSIRGITVEIGSKYKTLETIHTLPSVKFYTVEYNGSHKTFAAVFGHDNYLEVQKLLASRAVKTNRKIENTHNTEAKKWAKENWQNPLAKDRSKAWAEYLSFKDNVICIDFSHAMTVHKCQGSTYENVFIDIEDIGICADLDYSMYLKLLYVAISRASNKVYTN